MDCINTVLLDINAIAGVKAEVWRGMAITLHFSKIVQNHSGITIFTL